MESERRLLLLTCSKRKRSEGAELPALQRYNGPAFQVVRKFLSSTRQESQALSIYVISAEFGLIPGGQPIPDYDRKMTSQRATDLQESVVHEFGRILRLDHYREVFINLGKDYWKTLKGYEQQVPADVSVIVASGPQGRRLAELKYWLDGRLPLSQEVRRSRHVRSGKAMIKGIVVNLSSEEIVQIARQRLTEEQGLPANYFSWYVPIDDRKVAPKWLVSQITGLPLAAFVTDEARRVLDQLGIGVMHV